MKHVHFWAKLPRCVKLCLSWRYLEICLGINNLSHSNTGNNNAVQNKSVNHWNKQATGISDGYSLVRNLWIWRFLQGFQSLDKMLREQGIHSYFSPDCKMQTWSSPPILEDFHSVNHPGHLRTCQHHPAEYSWAWASIITLQCSAQPHQHRRELKLIAPLANYWTNKIFSAVLH